MWRRAIIATATVALAFAACDGGGRMASPDAAVDDAAVIDTAVIDAVPEATLTVVRIGSGTVVSVPAGIACGSTCTAPFPVGATVRLTPAVVNGVTFAGWSGACTGTGDCDLTIAGDTSVTATFTGVPCDDECTLGATDCPTQSAERTCGQHDGDTCTEWSPATACSDEACLFGRCGGAHPLTVSSVREGPIGDAIVTSSPAGILCGPLAPTCHAYFADGSDVTLTASSDDAAAFDGWEVAAGSNGAHCAGSVAPCTVSMTEATSLTAHFCWPSCDAGTVYCNSLTTVSTCGNHDDDRCLELGPPTACPDGTLCTAGGCQPAFLATAMPAGAAGQVALDTFVCGLLPCSKVVPAGMSVAVSAIPAPYTLFTGWSGACSGMGPCTLTSTGTAIGNFAERCVTTLTPNQGDAASIRVGADYVYWMRWRDMTRTAMRMAKGGGVPEVLATVNASYLVVDDPDVYWLRGGTVGTIERYSAGATVPVVTDMLIQHIAVNSTHVFYQKLSTIQRVAKAGGAPVQLAAALPGVAHALLADETHVYWFGGGQIVAIPVAGGAPLVLATGQGTLDEVTQDATHLYWGGSDKIARMPKTGGAVETLVSVLDAHSIAVHGDTLVWLGNAAYTTRIGSGVIQMLNPASALSTNRLIALDEDAIYLIDARTNADTVIELARSQTCAPTLP